MFGRAIRHKHAELCPIGARAMHLALRFHVTGELEAMDFTENDKWFDIKIMTDPRSGNNTKAMTDQTYRTAVKKVCDQLGIDSRHYTHIGRVTASGDLELKEIPGDEIDELGNWNVSVRDAIYSAKMPLRPMRGAGWLSADKGRHYSPRQMLSSSESLERMLFPCIEEKEADLERAALEHPNRKFTTARFFLKHLKNLRRVLLQDAAVLISKGRRHPVFNLPVFQCTEFENFRVAMMNHIAQAETVATQLAAAGSDAATSAAIANLGTAVDAQKIQEMSHFNILNGKLDTVMERQSTTVTRDAIAGAMRAGAAAMDGGGGSPPYRLGGFNSAVSFSSTSGTNSQFSGSSNGGVSDQLDQLSATAVTLPRPSSGVSQLRKLDLPPSLKSGRRAYNVWFGRGEFAGLPMEGGIDALARLPDLFKEWKRALSASEEKRLHRAHDFIIGIETYKREKQTTVDAAIEFLDTLLKEQAPDKAIKALKDGGYVPTGRKKRSYASITLATTQE